jgi:hypothetical protein
VPADIGLIAFIPQIALFVCDPAGNALIDLAMFLTLLELNFMILFLKCFRVNQNVVTRLIGVTEIVYMYFDLFYCPF